ncbi:MAG: glycosyltransferase family 2 protein, partial [Gaiellales bacterium]
MAHLGVLAVAGAVPPPPVALRAQNRTRFVVVVPGRDEEPVVVTAVRSLLAADYPRALLRIVVLADNCTDGTACAARAAGAEAWERHDLDRASKGAALEWAFERLLAEDVAWDAVLVLDADGTVAPDLLRVLDARIDSAAVLQAERRVGNPNPTLLSRLSEVSSDAQTVLRPRARQRLGGAAKLVGTGMVFRRDILATVPWRAHGLVEDLEYWLELLARGVRPQFEPRAQVADLMPDSLGDARRQRERWQAGRAGLARGQARVALRDAFHRRDPVMAEAVVSELL